VDKSRGAIGKRYSEVRILRRGSELSGRSARRDGVSPKRTG
jgi:hypothetical protein